MQLDDGLSSGQLLRTRHLFRSRLTCLPLGVLLLLGLLGSSSVEAQSRYGPRDFHEVTFVTPSVGWLDGGDVLHTTNGGQSLEGPADLGSERRDGSADAVS